METPEDDNDLILDQKNPSTVYTLDLSDKNLHNIPKSVCKYKLCKSLKLSCNGITSIRKDDFASCLQLKELKLYSNKLKTINGLSHLEKLEELHLQFNNISSIGDSFKNNKALKFLRLDSNKLSHIKLSEICMLAKLTYLDISSNKLEDIGCVNTLTSLEILYCTHNLITKLPSLLGLKKLKEVDFSFNLLSDASGLNSCNALQIITLNSNRISDLSSIGLLKMLQELKICDNFLLDLKHVSAQFNSLEVLEVSGNKVNSPTQINSLFMLSPTLRELSVYGNAMLDDPDNKAIIYNLIKNNLQLDVLDRNVCRKEEKVVKVTTPSVMRPMSACQIISQRAIEDQMNFSAMQMTELEEQIKSRFNDLNDSLMELPHMKTMHTKASKQIHGPPFNEILVTSELEERPTSRCGNRARLNEARAFAQEYFDV